MSRLALAVLAAMAAFGSSANLAGPPMQAFAAQLNTDRQPRNRKTASHKQNQRKQKGKK